MSDLAELRTKATLEPTLEQAEILWRELRDNELGGYSGINRPFWILGALKRAYTNGMEDAHTDAKSHGIGMPRSGQGLVSHREDSRFFRNQDKASSQSGETR
jgi:hypothetical protein